MVADAAASSAALESVHANYRDSADNLLHYLSLRRHDLRPLQVRLAALGLSSLGRAESHVLATVDAVLEVLHRARESRAARRGTQAPSVDFAQGQRLLAEHTDALLGPAAPGRSVRIMVTMPSEAAQEYTLVHDLLQQGMDCMRINCAHDDAATWLRMIEHLRQAERSLGRSCRVVMDLAGPKLRTGPIEPGSAVVRIRPRRDVYGRVTAPARVWLTADDVAHGAPVAGRRVRAGAAEWLARLRIGRRRRAHRCPRRRADVGRRGRAAAAGVGRRPTKTAYVVPGTILRQRRIAKARSARLPANENALSLQIGDLLIVTRDLEPGRPATHDRAGRVLTPAMIGCTIPEVFDDVRAGRVDLVRRRQDRRRDREGGQPAGWSFGSATRRLRGAKLRADKGINLPESELRLAAMTAKDIEDLAFVAEHADVVELSFANTARDVESLQEHLLRLGDRRPAIVLKIETRRGFENLPDMLLTAMRWPCCGVMIARGDLAVECGFERLAEVQEEILWISEAAHIPVIWATQVLETLAKEGMPSRAEITDAAMGHRAECVMLNKGPHVISAVRVLDDILRRCRHIKPRSARCSGSCDWRARDRRIRDRHRGSRR